MKELIKGYAENMGGIGGEMFLPKKQQVIEKNLL